MAIGWQLWNDWEGSNSGEQPPHKGPPAWPQLNVWARFTPAPLIMAMSRLTLYLGVFCSYGQPYPATLSITTTHFGSISNAVLPTKPLQSSQGRKVVGLEPLCIGTHPQILEALRPLDVKQTSGLGPGCLNTSTPQLVRVQSLVQVRWGIVGQRNGGGSTADLGTGELVSM